MPKIQINVEKQGDVFQAFLDANPRIWANGQTVDAAIVSLLRKHPTTFAINIVVNCICCGVSVPVVNANNHCENCAAAPGVKNG